jgi:hypothetical protein
MSAGEWPTDTTTGEQPHGLRFTPQEWAYMGQRAAQLGVSVNAYVRQLVAADHEATEREGDNGNGSTNAA